MQIKDLKRCLEGWSDEAEIIVLYPAQDRALYVSGLGPAHMGLAPYQGASENEKYYQPVAEAFAITVRESR